MTENRNPEDVDHFLRDCPLIGTVDWKCDFTFILSFGQFKKFDELALVRVADIDKQPKLEKNN